MDLTVVSERLEKLILTPGKYPKENIQVNQAFYFSVEGSTFGIGNMQQMAQESDSVHGKSSCT
jgi:hypothetical protein